jgi:hypothetical protein
MTQAIGEIREDIFSCDLIKRQLMSMLSRTQIGVYRYPGSGDASWAYYDPRYPNVSWPIGLSNRNWDWSYGNPREERRKSLIHEGWHWYNQTFGSYPDPTYDEYGAQHAETMCRDPNLIYFKAPGLYPFPSR